MIDRRILVNFRIEPEPLRDILPQGFEPRTVDGAAIGGVCCIRLKGIRPRGLPSAVGFDSENAAHRIGVEWDEDSERRSGVYVPRRDTSSRLNSVVGDRIFGRHYHADFEVNERNGRYSLEMESDQDGVRVRVDASKAEGFPDESIFESLSEASDYHRCGSVGYSPSPGGSCLEGVELDTDEWGMEPLDVDGVQASFFEENLPKDSFELDNALLMENIGHIWRQKPTKPAEVGQHS